VNAILVATDGGAAAAQALEVAIEIARDSGASLEILSVRPPFRDRHAGAPTLEVDGRAGPERIAGDAVKRARDAGVRASAHVAHGDVVSCIGNAARTLDAGLIVVGSRGLDPSRGDRLGSISRALVRRSPVSVTVVHEPATGDGDESLPASTSYVREPGLLDWSMFE
jgi:nucleotide-binding universal stress UspA family protein